MRGLIYVPIIHSDADLGSLGEVATARVDALIGPAPSGRRRESVNAMWNVIHSKLLAMPLPWPTVRVYQDGLPICGHELAIVQELSDKGSLNYSLLLELRSRGATLMGTEDPVLLVREYQRIQRLVELTRRPTHDPAAILAIRSEGEELLVLRDRGIANRILSTLAEGERGILFVGLLHRVDELLNKELRIQYLIRNLPLGAEPMRESDPTGES